MCGQPAAAAVEGLDFFSACAGQAAAAEAEAGLAPPLLVLLLLVRLFPFSTMAATRCCPAVLVWGGVNGQREGGQDSRHFVTAVIVVFVRKAKRAGWLLADRVQRQQGSAGSTDATTTCCL